MELRESWAQTEVERAMWQMQSAGCWESREQSSFEAVPCRMSFFPERKTESRETRPDTLPQVAQIVEILLEIDTDAGLLKALVLVEAVDGLREGLQLERV